MLRFMILQIEQFRSIGKETQQLSDEHDSALHIRMLEVLRIGWIWQILSMSVVLNLDQNRVACPCN